MTVAELTKPLRLNLGGAGEGFIDSHVQGFTTVDLRDVPETDIICDVSKLDVFEDRCAEYLYASNVLEHFPHAQTVDVLKEWRRVLQPGGKLFISVPDFDAAVKLYQKCGYTEWINFHLFGDQKHALNYHYTCFTFASLAKLVIDAGFSDVKRLVHLPFGAKDGSENVNNLTGEMISLNVEARN